MKTPATPATLAILFASIILMSDLGMGVAGYAEDVLRVDPPAHADDELGYRYEGGGSNLLLVDDFSGITADHYADMGLPDLYGGAVPTSRPGPGRWAFDPYRWGQEPTGASNTEAWDWESFGSDGALRFGSGLGNETVYPVFAAAAMVSPIIDLTSVPLPPGRTTSLRVDAGAPVLFSGTSGAAGSTVDIDSLNDQTYGTYTEGGVVGTDIETGVADASAALRLRHAYQFKTLANEWTDGGRVEASALLADGTWSTWTGVEPTNRQLVVQGTTLEGRVTTPVIQLPPPYDQLTINGGAHRVGADPSEFDVDAFLQDPQNYTLNVATGATFPGPNDGQPARANIFAPPTWLYRGTIEASGLTENGKWSGFGGASFDMVDSVFDLSPYAGHQIRLRFHVASSASTVDETDRAGLGWFIDHLELHAAGDAGIDLLDLTMPGQGAFLPVGTDVQPSILVHNKGLEPVRVSAEMHINDRRAGTMTQTIGTGPQARAVMNSAVFLSSIIDADHEGVVTVDIAAVAADPDQPSDNAAPTASRRFHFATGTEQAFEVLDLDIVRDADDDGTGRIVARGQPLQVHATILNAGNQPVRLNLTGPHADIMPRILDAAGRSAGDALQPLQDSIDLPPSSQVSGRLGMADAARVVSWQWSGTNEAVPLTLDIVDRDGEILIQGGRILVESSNPSPLQRDFLHDWLLSDGNPSTLEGHCFRQSTYQGVTGVVSCGRNGTLTSPVLALGNLAVRRGDKDDAGEDLRAQMTRIGGALNVTVHWHPVLPGAATPERNAPGWISLTSRTLPVAAAWDRAITDLLAEFDPGFLMITIQSLDPAGATLDAARVEVEESTRLWTDFNVDVKIQRRVIQKSGVTGLAWLNGIDEWSQATDVSTAGVTAQDGMYGIRSDGVTTPGAGGSSPRLTAAPGGAEILVPAGRTVDDSYLMTKRPLDLDVASPTLTFRHWLQSGANGIAHVQAAVATPLDAPRIADSLPDDGTVPPTPDADRRVADAGLDWQDLATFTGRSVSSETRKATVSLADFAGQQIHLRFLYKNNPGVSGDADGENRGAQVDLSDSQDAAGWLVEEVEVAGRGAQGQELLLAPAPNMPDMVLRGGYFDVVVASGTTETWEEPQGGPWLEPFLRRFQPFQCTAVAPPRTSAYADGAFVVTDAIDLSSSSRPILTVVTSGDYAYYTDGPGDPNGVKAERPIFDVEYQVLGPDGEWPALWTGTSRDPASLKVLPNARNLEPYPGEESAFPFGTVIVPEIAKSNSQSNIHQMNGVREVPAQFSLDKFVGETIRLRIGTWMQQPTAISPQVGDKCLGAIGDATQQSSVGGWQIDSVTIDERFHTADLGIEAVRFDPNDKSRILQQKPEIGSFAVDAVIAQDFVTVALDVGNFGLIDLDAEVSLSIAADDPTAGRANIRVLEGSEGALRLTPRSTATLTLESGATATAYFLVDATRMHNSNLTITGLIEPVGALDTNPSNDVAIASATLVPLRALNLDAAGARVEPYAATAEAARQVRIPVINDGTLDETDVRVVAELVRIEGIDEQVSLDPPVTKSWEGLEIASRGGRADLIWFLDQNLGDVLAAGGRYAVTIDIAAGPESISLPPRDLAGLLARPASQHLLAMIVEGALYTTAFDGASTESLLPHLLAADTPPQDLWTTSTVRNKIAADDDPNLPHWTLVPAEDLDMEGPAQGNAWVLPPYDGLETVEHTLTSPVLPTQVVAADSRAILGMRYGDDDGTGQMVIETRTLDGDAWTDWGPPDLLRRQRFAIIVAPDFPVMTEYLTGSARADGSIPGHPVPPWYQFDPQLQPVGCRTAADTYCDWAPWPWFDRSGNQEALQALHDTLVALADEVGPSNVDLFTTVNDDLDVGATDHNGRWIIELEGDLPYSFPVESLQTLGTRLDTYGTVLLLGDNTTTVTAHESALLASASHRPSESLIGRYPDLAAMPAYLGEPDALGQRHFEQVMAILRAAPAAGVSSVAAVGPATATLAKSGIIAGHEVTTWQATGAQDSPNWSTHCMVSSLDPVSLSGLHTTQPRPLCTRQEVGAPQAVEARDSRYNYRLLQPDMTHSALILEAIESGNAAFIPNRELVGQTLVIKPKDIVHSSINGFNVVTASGAGTVAGLVNKLLLAAGAPQAASVAPVALPGTNGEWLDLPGPLSSPVGGELLRRDDGTIAFEGAPMQVRLRVQSGPNGAGHGSFALESLGVLGSTAEHDVGVRFATPVEGRRYAPNSPLAVDVEVTNRGTQPSEPLQVKVRAQRVDDVNCTESCRDATVETRSITVPAMLGGQRRVVSIDDAVAGGPLYAGRFPQPTGVDPEREITRFKFGAAILDTGDPQTANDFANVTALGQQVVDIDLSSFTVTPNIATRDGVNTVDLALSVYNSGTQGSPVTIDITLEDARPVACHAGEAAKLFACHAGTETPATPLLELSASPSVGRDETFLQTFTIDLDERNIPAGVYRLRADVRAYSGPVERDRAVIDQWLHLADAAIEPDGAWASFANTLDNLPSFHGSPLPASEFIVESLGDRSPGHDGRLGPDANVRDASGEVQWHGWARGIGLDYPPGRPEGHDNEGASLIWSRTSGQGWSPAESRTWPAESYADGQAHNQGHGDFGPDAVTWTPYALDSDHIASLAHYEAPHLSFAQRRQTAGDNSTAFVVQMAVAQRACQGGGINAASCSWVWDWGDNATRWFSLTNDDTSYDVAAGEIVFAQAPVGPPDGQNRYRVPEQCVSNPGSALNPFTCERRFGTNDLSGQPGFWSASSHGHQANEGWERTTFRLTPEAQSHAFASSGQDFVYPNGLADYCDAVSAADGATGVAWSDPLEPCRYALSFPGPDGDLVPRPVRFRFVAASSGDVSGSASWRIDDLALTSHHIRFDEEHATKTLSMTDDEDYQFAIFVRNDGAAQDIVDLDWEFSNRFPVSDVSVGMSLDKHAPPNQTLSLNILPGEAIPVYVTVSVGLRTGFENDPNVDISFLLRAQSRFDPLAEDSIFVAATFAAREWADLEVLDLVLGDDRASSPFTASVNVPIPLTLIVVNDGALAFGRPGDAATVVVWEERVDPETGAVLETRPALDAEGNPLQTSLEGVLQPFATTRKSLNIDDLEWTPRQEGVYNLVAAINLDDNPFDRLPENDLTNNLRERFVVVGPVRLSELVIQETWMETLQGERVERVTDGHFYRAGALVANIGQAAALQTSVEFRFGAADAFSIRNQENFPGGTTATYLSSPWRAISPASGSGSWPLTVDVSSNSASASLQGKSLVLPVPVDTYRLAVTAVPPQVEVGPDERVIVRLNVTNTGNAVATPVATISADAPGLRVHMVHAPPLVPGETQPLELVVTTAPSLSADARIDGFVLSAQEDDKAVTPVAMAITATTQALAPLSTFVFSEPAAVPGPLALQAALDSQSNAPSTWQIHDITGPFEFDAAWTSSLGPFERALVTVPVSVQPHTPPGDHGAEITFHVQQGEVTRAVIGQFNARVESAPGVTVYANQTEVVAVAGQPGAIEIHVVNHGNTPVDISHTHDIDFGRVEAPNEQFVLAAGDETRIPLEVVAGHQEHVLGASTVSWRHGDGAWSDLEPIRWRVQQEAGKVRFIDSDLPTTATMKSGTHTIEAVIENGGQSAFTAEVLAVVDGTIHDRQMIELKRLQQATVVVSLTVPADAETHQVQLLARPAGSSLTVQDEAYFDVADAITHDVAVTSDNAVPGLASGLLVVALLLGAALRRGSRWR